ncbi:hypothetical protein COCNU_scaffold018848G000010 [Cocos nucifera]|nr:hypothetical protein [Cocos nucifera]
MSYFNILLAGDGMETAADGITREGTFDGSGGNLPQKLALQGLFLMSLALTCLIHPLQEGLSPRESFPVAFYYLVLLVLFLSGQAYMLLSLWASDLPISRSALAKQLVK